MPSNRNAVFLSFRKRVVLALFAVLWMPLAAWGATIYVDIANTSGTEDGTSWPTAFNTIQEGINASVSNDTVLVAPGTYTENLIVLHDVHLLSTNINAPQNYIIDGNNQGNVIWFESDEYAIPYEYHTENSEVAGFTIQHGRAINGGGIAGSATRNAAHESGVPAHIHHNIIQDNVADGFSPLYDSGCGGGLYMCTGLVELNTIRNNNAYRVGAAICNRPESDFYEANVHYGVFRQNLVENNISLRDGLYITGPSGVDGVYEASRNIIRGNQGNNGSAVSHSIYVRNNLIHGNTTLDGGTLHDCQYIENNTIVSNLLSGTSQCPARVGIGLLRW